AETNCIPVGIPNAFTPNGDGKNDLFRPVLNREITEYRLQVFNRNGQLLFQSRKPGEGWDGRFLSQYAEPGSYVYVLRFRDLSGKHFTYKGNISLLR
ncbi:MAG TPA: gliding motility-associated C-terminal domain-containing protein, partial [Ferruginibacter sp.]|nr:gliding motility-associated C-terminal domain-containing protein [Ferruginibacter sp.]